MDDLQYFITFFVLYTFPPPNWIVAVPHLAATWTNEDSPDGKVHGANMGPIWGWQDPGRPHVGPMNLAIWVIVYQTKFMEI